ncbi:hypothetical protein [Chitinimonas arctica]|nr:hypothetical protein [Chitinimonas arctica]
MARLSANDPAFSSCSLCGLPTDDESTFVIDTTRLEEFVTALAGNSHLKDLSLSNLGITDTGMQAIASAVMRRQASLARFSVHDNRVGRNGIAAIAALLTDPVCQLHQLELKNCKIDTSGAHTLAEAIHSDANTLTALKLRHNDVGDAGAAVIAYALAQPQCGLLELELTNNRIGNAGASSLARTLALDHCRLNVLQLGLNHIDCTGACSLGEAIGKNGTLLRLYLFTNRIGRLGAQGLAKALVSNTSLTVLHLAHNPIAYEGAIYFAAALAQNYRLTQLSLSDRRVKNKVELGIALKFIDSALLRNEESAFHTAAILHKLAKKSLEAGNPHGACVFLQQTRRLGLGEIQQDMLADTMDAAQGQISRAADLTRLGLLRLQAQHRELARLSFERALTIDYKQPQAWQALKQIDRELSERLPVDAGAPENIPLSTPR